MQKKQEEQVEARNAVEQRVVNIANCIAGSLNSLLRYVNIYT
jgi:hypothetical protein